jgi:hypothetical protein
MDEIEFGYQPPRKLDEDLWEFRGDWKNKLGRRMTVIRLRDGRLVLHSSIRLRQGDLDWLLSQGTPSVIIAPNVFHCSDAGWMAKKFPAAELFVPKSKFKLFRSMGLSPKDVNSDFPMTIADQLKCIPIQGTRFEEAAFLHIPSRTLVLCDLAFNMGDVFSGIEKLLMKWNRVGGQFGPSRLTKLVFAKDSRLLLSSYRDLLKEDFDRVIVNHGEVIKSGGRVGLSVGIERVFGPLIN